MGRGKGSRNKKGLLKQLTLLCKTCDKEFTCYPSYRDQPRQYCSTVCYRDSRKGWVPSQETRDKLKRSRAGKKPTLGRITPIKTRRLLSKALKGSKCARWKGGINPINDSIRKSLDYKIWREEVFKRDKYKCNACGAKNGNGTTVVLNAHHIKEFAQRPELRLEVSNGVTLCKGCHDMEHKKEAIQDEYISKVS